MSTASNDNGTLIMSNMLSLLSLRWLKDRPNDKMEGFSHEPLADHPFYDFRLFSAIQQAKELASKIVARLETCSLVTTNLNSEISKLSKEAKRLSNFACSETRVVGLIGESGQGKFVTLQPLGLTRGQGKSSLINSLLNVQDIARTV